MGSREGLSDSGDVLGADRFETSALGEGVLSKYGFTVHAVGERTTALVRD